MEKRKLTIDEYKAISKEIKKLVNEGQYEEALEWCTDENCKGNVAIETQKIGIWFKQKRKPKEIIEECGKTLKIFKGNDILNRQKLVAISQLIKELINKEQDEEALKWCTDENCKENVAIETQKIDIWFKQKRKPKEIIEECEKALKIFKGNDILHRQKLVAISQLIKELINKEQDEEALKWCTDENCKENVVIQVQKINIWFKQKRNPKEIVEECEKALKIFKGNDILHRQKLVAISQLIKELINKEQDEEALKWCTDENCKEDVVIQVQKINIWFKQKRNPKEIVEECEKALKIFKGNDILNRQKLIAIRQLIKELKSERKYEEDLECCTDVNGKQNNIYIVNYFYFDSFLEEFYRLAKNNQIKELKKLLKRYLKNTDNLELENTLMRLVDFIVDSVAREGDEYNWNKKFAILTEAIMEIGLTNSQKRKYYLEKRIKRDYFGEEEKIYKYSKINQMDLVYNYNIPYIDYFIDKIQTNEFEYKDLEKLGTLPENYPYVFAILARECFWMNQVENGNKFLKNAYEIMAKQKENDKELQYFIKAIEYYKNILSFYERIPFNEGIKRILIK